MLPKKQSMIRLSVGEKVSKEAPPPNQNPRHMGQWINPPIKGQSTTFFLRGSIRWATAIPLDAPNTAKTQTMTAKVS